MSRGLLRRGLKDPDSHVVTKKTELITLLRRNAGGELERIIESTVSARNTSSQKRTSRNSPLLEILGNSSIFTAIVQTCPEPRNSQGILIEIPGPFPLNSGRNSEPRLSGKFSCTLGNLLDNTLRARRNSHFLGRSANWVSPVRAAQSAGEGITQPASPILCHSSHSWQHALKAMQETMAAREHNYTAA